MTDLGYIDDHPITGRSLKLTKAGDGLSEALQLKDTDLHVGDDVLVLVKGKVEGPTFKPDKKNQNDEGYIRIDNIVASSAQVVTDQDSIAALADEHEAAIAEQRRLAEQQKKGIKELFDEDTDGQQAAEDGLGPDDNTGNPLQPVADDPAERAGIPPDAGD